MSFLKSEKSSTETGGLHEKIAAGLAKLEALEFLQVNQRMNRDSDRLHQKALATYKKLGLDLTEKAEDMRDHIVLGDQISVGDVEANKRPSLLSRLLPILILSAAILVGGATGTAGRHFL